MHSSQIFSLRFIIFLNLFVFGFLFSGNAVDRITANRTFLFPNAPATQPPTNELLTRTMLNRLKNTPGFLSLTPTEKKRLFDILLNCGFLSIDQQNWWVHQTDFAQLLSADASSQTIELRKVFKRAPTGGTTGISYAGIQVILPHHFDPEHREGKNYASDLHVGQWKIHFIWPVPNSPEIPLMGNAICALPNPIIGLVHVVTRFNDNYGSFNAGGGHLDLHGQGKENGWAFQGVRHEFGHLLDSQFSINASHVWEKQIAADHLSVSGYGDTNRFEDLAEFMRLTINTENDPTQLQAVAHAYPNRYKTLQSYLIRLQH